MSPLPGARADDEFPGLWQHSPQRLEIHRVVFLQGGFDFFRMSQGIVEGGLDFGLRPVKVFGHGGGIIFMVAGHQHDFPDGQRAALQAGLAAGGRIAEINEGKFRAAQAFLDQPGAGIAGRPAVPARQAFEARAARGREPHANHN